MPTCHKFLLLGLLGVAVFATSLRTLKANTWSEHDQTAQSDISSNASQSAKSSTAKNTDVRREDEFFDQEGHDEQLLEHVLDAGSQSVRTVLLDHEVPLLGISWGWSILADTPPNNEPPGASPTIRVSKLKFHKVLSDNWTAKFVMDYNDAGGFELGNNYLLYTGWSKSLVKLGVFTPAFSLEQASQREGTVFMERALTIEALAERRSGGANFLRRTDNAIMNAGIYFFSPDYQGQSESGQALVLRYVHAPLHRSDRWHWLDARKIWTGVSLSYRTNASGLNTQFRSRPEVATIDEYSVDTGPISGANQIWRLGLEASQVLGPLSWQIELLRSRVDRTGQPAVQFDGGYALLSWFVTGETRKYDPTQGQFLLTEPIRALGQGGWGALEVAARISYVDLTDKDILGGKQTNLSAALNWTPTRRWRLMANIIKVLDLDRPDISEHGNNPLIFALRAQWYLN